MKILLDGDACPGPTKEIAVEMAEERGIKVIHVASVAHWSANIVAHEVIWVDNVDQEADMVITNLVARGDIVVTADYGLSTLVLSRGGAAISPRGYIFSGEDIEKLLFERYLGAKVRRGGGKTKGPRVHSPEDNQRFKKNLGILLDSAG